MTRTMWELTLGNESVLFASEMDAASAMAALARGVTVAGAADPLRPRARVRLESIITVLRRVEVPVPGRRESRRLMERYRRLGIECERKQEVGT